MKKKTWEKPQLIVLVRQKTEESVLSACKNFIEPGGAYSINSACQTSPIPDCPACDTQTIS